MAGTSGGAESETARDERRPASKLFDRAELARAHAVMNVGVAVWLTRQHDLYRLELRHHLEEIRVLAKERRARPARF